VHLLRGGGAPATARVAGAGGGVAAYTWRVTRGTLPARFGAHRLMACLTPWRLGWPLSRPLGAWIAPLGCLDLGYDHVPRPALQRIIPGLESSENKGKSPR
jgi:hypothetical protein